MIKKIKKYLYYLSILFFVGITVFIVIKKDDLITLTKKGIFGDSGGGSGGGSPMDGDTFSYNMIQALNIGEPPKNRKELLSKFCKVLLVPQTNEDGEKIDLSSGIVGEGAKLYELKKSVFLYNLCNFVSKDYKDSFDEDTNVLKEVSLETDECQPSKDMNSCNFSTIVPNLFRGIMNEYGNIKLMSVLGFTKEDEEESIKAFSDKYFGTGFCGDYIYLNKEKIEEEKYRFCSHPKTYKLLQEYLKGTQSLKNTKYLDYEKLKSDPNNYFTQALIDISEEEGENNGPKNFDRFKDIMYNELMYYNLFISFYGNSIKNDQNLSEFKITSDVGAIFDDANNELLVLEKEIKLSQQSIYQIDRLLANMYTSFPLHIGMMAYYEDVLTFREEFKKVYTPLHQLYYKLRNVQDLRR